MRASLRALREEPADLENSGVRPTVREFLPSAAPTVEGFPRIAGNWLISVPFGVGGMGSVHLGVHRPTGRTFALKRLHPHLASDDYFCEMLWDEAAIASRVRHPNVVAMHGATVIDGELFLVMEYVPGLPLSVLIQNAHPGTLPPRIAAAIVAGVLRGLHAAHEAVDEHGRPLGIVHRDVAPQNILIGFDGVPRILDFGIAKAAQRIQNTPVGERKGRIAYMSPEQLLAGVVDRRTDIRACAVVLWETLVGVPLFHAESDGHMLTKVLDGRWQRPGKLVAGVPLELDAVVVRGLAKRREDRFDTALYMARTLEAIFASNPVSPQEISQWVVGRVPPPQIPLPLSGTRWSLLAILSVALFAVSTAIGVLVSDWVLSASGV